MHTTLVRSALTAEARAFFRMAALLPLDLLPRRPQAVPAGTQVVVLVHGLMATAGVMRPLRERLEKLGGVGTAAFTYAPSEGVESVAASVGALVRSLPASTGVHLVGHSMGGLAVRWFVQEQGGDVRVLQTTSVAAPFEGARGAWFMPGRAGRDIAAGSPVLARLRASARGCLVPHLSVLGAADTAVAFTTDLGVGERLIVRGCGHNGLLFHQEVLDSVVTRVSDFARGLARP